MNTPTIADMLTEHRINWSRLEEMDADLYAILADAVGAGDTVLERRVKAAINRRALRWYREGRI